MWDMTHTKHLTFRLPPAMIAALEAIRVRDGVTVGEQIRRGVQLWIDQKAPKRAKAARA
jgi:hypothetical protein